MTERLLRDWLDEDVDQEKLAEGAAAIEEGRKGASGGPDGRRAQKGASKYAGWSFWRP